MKYEFYVNENRVNKNMVNGLIGKDEADNMIQSLVDDDVEVTRWYSNDIKVTCTNVCTTKRELLELNVNARKGSCDYAVYSGEYAISYNSGLEYVSIYKIDMKRYKEGYENYIDEGFLQYYELKEYLGKRFFVVSDKTKMKKCKDYINAYIY